MIQAPGTISRVPATGSPLCQSSVVLSSFSSKTTWSSCWMAAMPGCKSQRQSSSAAPFPTPPTISYTCQHSHILPALLGCYSKSGQVWPPGKSQSSASFNAGAIPRGSCLPVTSWFELTPIPLAHSVAWPQLFNISMKPDI